MKYSGHRKLLCELSKLSKFNAFNPLGYKTYTDESILVYRFRPERTGFNMYAQYTQLQLTFLASLPYSMFLIQVFFLILIKTARLFPKVDLLINQLQFLYANKSCTIFDILPIFLFLSFGSFIDLYFGTPHNNNIQ